MDETARIVRFINSYLRMSQHNTDFAKVNQLHIGDNIEVNGRPYTFDNCLSQEHIGYWSTTVSITDEFGVTHHLPIQEFNRLTIRQIRR